MVMYLQQSPELQKLVRKIKCSKAIDYFLKLMESFNNVSNSSNSPGTILPQQKENKSIIIRQEKTQFTTIIEADVISFSRTILSNCLTHYDKGIAEKIASLDKEHYAMLYGYLIKELRPIVRLDKLFYSIADLLFKEYVTKRLPITSTILHRNSLDSCIITIPTLLLKKEVVEGMLEEKREQSNEKDKQPSTHSSLVDSYVLSLPNHNTSDSGKKIEILFQLRHNFISFYYYNKSNGLNVTIYYDNNSIRTNSSALLQYIDNGKCSINQLLQIITSKKRLSKLQLPDIRMCSLIAQLRYQPPSS